MNEVTIGNSPVSDMSSLVNQNASSKSGNEKVHAVQQAEQLKEVKEPAHQAELSETVENINSFVQNMQRGLSFSIDKESGKDIVSVVDKSTNELIRQIPSEEALELMQNLDKISGLLFDSKV